MAARRGRPERALRSARFALARTRRWPAAAQISRWSSLRTQGGRAPGRACYWVGIRPGTAPAPEPDPEPEPEPLILALALAPTLTLTGGHDLRVLGS